MFQRAFTYLFDRPSIFSLQYFDTVGWTSERAAGLQKSSDEVLAWLSVWNEVQSVAYGPVMPLPPHHLLLHENPQWFNLFDADLSRLSWKRGR